VEDEKGTHIRVCVGGGEIHSIKREKNTRGQALINSKKALGCHCYIKKQRSKEGRRTVIIELIKEGLMSQTHHDACPHPES
jgi:hypothetical protein